MNIKVNVYSQVRSFLVVFLVMALISGCGQTQRLKKGPSMSENEVSKLNEQIVRRSMNDATGKNSLEYILGPGDVMSITVFQVSELDTRVRVDGKGNIILPLLGTISVKDKTVSQLEAVLVKELSKKYLQDPQVSLFVEEYRSQEINVMGAVSSPNIYSVRRSYSVLELLSLAGGLTADAGNNVYLQVSRKNSDNEIIISDIIVGINELLTGENKDLREIRLTGGDSVYIPKAGVVFVKGAVKNPGAYNINSKMTVAKAITVAGGAYWESNKNSVRVLREKSGLIDTIPVDIDNKDVQLKNFYLEDGDVLIVNYNVVKRGVAGVFRGLSRIISVSAGYDYNLNDR